MVFVNNFVDVPYCFNDVILAFFPSFLFVLFCLFSSVNYLSLTLLCVTFLNYVSFRELGSVGWGGREWRRFTM